MKNYENNPKAEAVIKEVLAAGILDQAGGKLVEASTICDTSDYGFSQTRKIALACVVNGYRVEALVYISAEIVRPDESTPETPASHPSEQTA